MNFVFDCRNWPLNITFPEFCCNYPPLITESLRKDFRAKCGTRSHRENALCVKAMLDKKFKPNGKYDFNEIKTTLLGNINSNVSRKWSDVIDTANEVCKNFVEGLKIKVSIDSETSKFLCFFDSS